jgi:hypothetical protein
MTGFAVGQFKRYLEPLDDGWNPETPEAIEQAQQRMGVGFPDWLIALLTDCGRCMGNCEIESSEGKWFPLDGLDGLERLESAFEWKEGFRENGLLAFGSSVLEGSPFVYATDSGKFWFVDYYAGGERHHLGDSFDEFVSRARSCPDD